MPEQPMEEGKPAMMAPEPAAAAPTSAETKQVVEEGLNVAVQAGLEASEAAKADPTIPPETTQKIEAAVVTLAEAQEELAAPAVAAPVAGTAAGVPPGAGAVPPVA